MFMLSRALPCGVIVVLAAGYGHTGRLHAAAAQTPGAPASTSDAASAASSQALLSEVLHHLPQRKTENGRAHARQGRPPACRCGRGPVGKGGAEDPQRRDAPGRTAPARQADVRQVRDVAGKRARSRGSGASESGPPRRSSPEPGRVLQRDSRHARAGYQRGIAAAEPTSRTTGSTTLPMSSRFRRRCSSGTCSRAKGSAGSPSAIRRSLPPSRRSTSPAASGRTSGCTTTCRTARAAARSFATTSRSTASMS